MIAQCNNCGKPFDTSLYHRCNLEDLGPSSYDFRVQSSGGFVASAPIQTDREILLQIRDTLQQILEKMK